MVATKRKQKSGMLEKPVQRDRKENQEVKSNQNGTPVSMEPQTLRRKAQPTFFRKCCSLLKSSIKYIILTILIPPFLNYVAITQESKELLPEGALYDIGYGQKLFLSCLGEGLPTVILDAPTGMSSDAWALIHGELSKVTKVCMYDRAGLGFSDRPSSNYSHFVSADDGEENDFVNSFSANKWQEFTVERMADDLHRLITYSSQQERPFIMVGAEMGALVSRFYSQIYESEVSDLVLVDPLVEDLFTYDDGVWVPYWSRHLVPSFQTMQVSAAVGLTRLSLLLGLIEPPITGEQVDQLEPVVQRQKHLLCHPRHMSSVVDEHHFINESFSQMQTLFMMKRFPSNISVTVINGNYYDDQLPSGLNKAWAKSQQKLMSDLHPGSNQILVNGADHHMLYRQPKAIIEPVKRLVKQWRNKNRTKKPQ